MKYLILVKHSLPEIVKNVPASEWTLSKKGRALAQTLAEKLAHYQPEILISSIEPKALQTAEIIRNSLGLNLITVENLHEHDRRKTSYLSKHDFEASVQKFFNKPEKLVFGSETANQAHKRFRDAVFSVQKRFPNQTILIVSHGTVISLFVSRLLGIAEFLFWQELGLPAFVVLDIQSNTLITQENI